jgi:hypothetical protein
MQPQLELRLSTEFLCDRKSTHSWNGPPVDSQLHDTGDVWNEWTLPIRKHKISRSKYSRGGQYRHTGRLDVRVNIAPEMDAEREQGTIRHYLDPQALSPVISLSATRPAEQDFPLLNQVVAEESVETMLRNRYGEGAFNIRERGHVCRQKKYRYGQAQCWTRNMGGAYVHAAKLWETKLAQERGEIGF